MLRPISAASSSPSLSRFSSPRGRYVLSGEGATKQLKGITPPLIRLRAHNHRIFFRDQGDALKIERVLDRKEAYR